MTVASDVGIGDLETPRLTVSPFDDTTVATLTVTAPDGTTSSPTVGTSDGGQTWTASPVAYTQAGRWLLTWTVTGTGAGVETQQVYVVASPVAGGPTWLPGRSRVANYVPTRTLAKNPGTYTESGDTYELTFDSTTRPTGLMVDRLIADGAAWVTAAVPFVAPRLYDMASVCAALWAAAAVERGWPETDVSLQRAEQLQQLAEQARADLIAANRDETGTTPGDSHAPLPVWSFPAPVPWGDDLL